MDIKSSIFVLVTIVMVSSLVAVNGKAVLRRVPKIYNALITTDDNLLSSQAIPIIQPTIHETGVFHYALHPYSFVSAAALKPHPPGYIYPTSLVQFPPQLVPHHLHSQFLTIPENHMENSTTNHSSDTKDSKEKPTEQMDTIEPTNGDKSTESKTERDQENTHKNLLPIPLNHHEVPPALIPLREVHTYNAPVLRLPPYTFSQYSPVVYDPLISLTQPYLPPIDYLPNNLHTRYSNNLPLGKLQAINVDDNSVESSTRNNVDLNNNNNIDGNSSPQRQMIVKNGARSNVPDIPPPPLPINIKSTQAH